MKSSFAFSNWVLNKFRHSFNIDEEQFQSILSSIDTNIWQEFLNSDTCASLTKDAVDNIIPSLVQKMPKITRSKPANKKQTKSHSDAQTSTEEYVTDEQPPEPEEKKKRGGGRKKVEAEPAESSDEHPKPEEKKKRGGGRKKVEAEVVADAVAVTEAAESSDEPAKPEEKKKRGGGRKKVEAEVVADAVAVTEAAESSDEHPKPEEKKKRGGGRKKVEAEPVVVTDAEGPNEPPKPEEKKKRGGGRKKVEAEIQETANTVAEENIEVVIPIKELEQLNLNQPENDELTNGPYIPVTKPRERTYTEPSIETKAYNRDNMEAEDKDAEEDEEEETLTEVFISDVLHYQDTKGNLYDSELNPL